MSLVDRRVIGVETLVIVIVIGCGEPVEEPSRPRFSTLVHTIMSASSTGFSIGFPQAFATLIERVTGALTFSW